MAPTENPRASAHTGGERPKRGRPKKYVDLELVEKLAHIQCTHAEIASTLGVSVDTLQRNEHFAATYKRGAEGGRKSLRRMQFESANRGNVAMQIWLGKQYLGQTDKGALEVVSLPTSTQARAEQLRSLLLDSSPEDLNELIHAMEDRYGMLRSELEKQAPKSILPASYTVEQD